MRTRRSRARGWTSAASAVGMLAALLMLAPGAVAAGAPDLAISVSSSASGAVSVGDSFSYTVNVTNDGTAPARRVVIQDDFPVGITPSVPPPSVPGGSCSLVSSQQTGEPPHTSATCRLAAIAAGSSVELTIDVRVTHDATCGAVTNSPHVAASNEPAGSLGDNTASVTDTVACPPSLTAAVRAPSYAHAGQRIGLAMVVRNTGGIELGGVHVANAACAAAIEQIDDGDGDATLAAGETWLYRCDARVKPASGVLVTRVIASASASASGTSVRASDRATVRVLHPALALRIIPDPVSGPVGGTITYRYVVHNVGNATVTDISVDDDRLGAVAHLDRLLPGHAAIFTVERVVRANDPWVVNEATVSGTDLGGRSVTATDTARVTIVADTEATGVKGRTGADATAFTGGDATIPGALGILLALIGAVAVVLARREHT